MTGNFAALLATMAMPVPICPEPTTPKDLTVDKVNNDLNIMILSLQSCNYTNGDMFSITITNKC